MNFIGYHLGLLILTSYHLMQTKASDAWYSAVRSTSTTDSDVCAVDPPTVALSTKKTSGSAMRCASECTAYSPCCVTFQYDAVVEQCQLYDYSPSNYTPVVNCKAFTLSGNLSNLTYFDDSSDKFDNCNVTVGKTVAYLL